MHLWHYGLNDAKHINWLKHGDIDASVPWTTIQVMACHLFQIIT